MIGQVQKAEVFNNLHVKGCPLVLYNIWDAGSAQCLESKAIATSSWSVAAALGYQDGEEVPFELVIENLKRIISRVDLPVSIDLEAGYGRTPDSIYKSTTAILNAGAIGVNIEDQVIGENRLFTPQQQSKRLLSVREAADQKSIPMFLNARTDLFFQTKSDEHDENLIQQVLERAHLYQDSGANGLFVPGLTDLKLIEMLCNGTNLHINIMVGNDMLDISKLSELGVSRISFGPAPYVELMKVFKENVEKDISI